MKMNMTFSADVHAKGNEFTIQFLPFRIALNGSLLSSCIALNDPLYFRADDGQTKPKRLSSLTLPDADLKGCNAMM
jgi:hypothetical protein